MAREYSFEAVLTFQFADQDEMTSMRTTAKNFAAAQGGTAEIYTREDDDQIPPYWGKLVLNIPVASRAEASSLMGTIDAALPTLPELVTTNGKKLSYDFTEIDV
jgi:hypothetical protein